MTFDAAGVTADDPQPYEGDPAQRPADPPGAAPLHAVPAPPGDDEAIDVVYRRLSAANDVLRDENALLRDFVEHVAQTPMSQRQVGERAAGVLTNLRVIREERLRVFQAEAGQRRREG